MRYPNAGTPVAASILSVSSTALQAKETQCNIQYAYATLNRGVHHHVTYNMQPTTYKRLVQHTREIAQG